MALGVCIQSKSAPLEHSEGKAKLSDTQGMPLSPCWTFAPVKRISPLGLRSNLAEKSGGLDIALDAACDFDEARYFRISRKLIWIVIATKIFREFFWVVAVRP